MLLPLLFFILILYLLYYFPSSHHQKLSHFSIILSHVYHVYLISHPSLTNLNFHLVLSNSFTYVSNKSIIHLVIWNPLSNTFFDYNTISSAVIHELAHILCPDLNHSPQFDLIEHELLSIAHSLGYYNPSLSIDPTYPCSNH